MKKILFLISLAILGSVILPLKFALAQLGRYGRPISYLSILNSIETFVWVLFTGVVVVCFVWAGILFLTSQGEPDKIKTARSAVVWGVVGIIVGIIAYSIVAIMSGVLTGGFLWGSYYSGCPSGTEIHIDIQGTIPNGAYQVSGGYCW